VDGAAAASSVGLLLAAAPTEHEPRHGERAPDAAVRGEALAELEDRVDVALARVREQEDVDTVHRVCIRHGGH
jgi:broad specificity phosphatase PhoE